MFATFRQKFGPSRPLASLLCSLFNSDVNWQEAYKVESLNSNEANYSLKSSSKGEVWNERFKSVLARVLPANRAFGSLTLSLRWLMPFSNILPFLVISIKSLHPALKY